MITEQYSREIREIETILHQHMDLFGYELIDMPIIADADIFLTRAGNSIVEQLFTFERFGRLLALRPEFTALLAHRYAQEKHTKPVRWQLSGAIFVDEPSDYSLQYQHHNIGAEFIGQSSTLADAELMIMAVDGLEKLGVENWQLVIGHVGLQLHLLSQFGLNSRTQRILLTQRERLKEVGKQAVLDYLSDILMLEDTKDSANSVNGDETGKMLDMLLDLTHQTNTMGGRTRHDIAERIIKKHERGLEYEKISQALDFLQVWGNMRGTFNDVVDKIKPFIVDDDTYGQSLLSKWLEVLQTLSAYGLDVSRMIIQPDLTKNWDYYTGFVFGIRVNGDYVASGGRYDGLTKLLGSHEEIPAVGFAYYTHRLLESLPTNTNTEPVYTLKSKASHEAISWAQTLRAVDITIELVTDSENVDIEIIDNQAHYKDKVFSREQLIEEII